MSTPDPLLTPFRVGEWVVLPESHEILRDGTRTRLQPRLIAVLKRLAQTPGRTVTRDALLEAAWNRKVVNDEVLSRTIADLRLALGDDAREPRYVETIPKLGYRLVAAVSSTNLDPTDSGQPQNDETPAVDLAPAPAAKTQSSPPAARERNGRPALILLLGTIVVLVAFAVIRNSRIGPPPGAAIDAALLAQAQPLTSDPGWEQSPRFSNDGQWLAYSAREPDARTAQIVLRSRDGQEMRAVTAGHWDMCPLFLPGDTQVVFTRHARGSCELMSQSLQSDTAVRLADCASGVRSCPALAGDGKSILFSAPPSSTDHAAGIAGFRLRDGEMTALTSPPVNAGDDVDPRAAADGKLYFVRGAESERAIHVVEDGVERRLPIANSMVYGLALTDGRLVFASDVLGFRALVEHDPMTSVTRLLGARGARYPDVSSAGDLVYEVASYDANLWLHDLEGKPGERLTASTRYDAYPRLSPDGTRVAFQSNRDGLEAIYLLDLGTRAEQRLPLDASLRWAHPSWSPDGSTLVLTAYAPAGTEIWRYRPGSQGAEKLTLLELGAHDPQFDPDGTGLWYLLDVDGHSQLRRAPLDGAGTAFELGRPVMHYLVDPQGLFFLEPDQDVLQRCPLADLTNCASLPIEIVGEQRRNWTVADDAVFFVGVAADGKGQLQRYQLSTGMTSATTWPLPSTLSRAIDVTRDGSRAIISTTDKLDIDLMWVRRRADDA